MAIQIWIRCPICESKTRNRIKEDTVKTIDYRAKKRTGLLSTI